MGAEERLGADGQECLWNQRTDVLEIFMVHGIHNDGEFWYQEILARVVIK